VELVIKCSSAIAQLLRGADGEKTTERTLSGWGFQFEQFKLINGRLSSVCNLKRKILYLLLASNRVQTRRKFMKKGYVVIVTRIIKYKSSNG